jgi:uncharacterized protein YecE (DUF72 family)
MPKKGSVFVGTSGWNYAHWKRRFYPDRLPADQWLAYYARFFDTVEVNKSFYRLIDDASYRRWRQTTPKKFIFAVKGSRFLTHFRRLKETQLGLRRFFDPLKELAPKRGPVLFQLPPHWHKNTERLDDFISALPKNVSSVFEFRDETWFTDDVYAVLRKHKAALCINDYQGKEFSPRVVTSNEMTYLRFHGPASYGEKRLAKD